MGRREHGTRKTGIMVAPGKVKSTYDIDVRLKRKLSVLKADLRAAGVNVTEAMILEQLIDDADIKTLVKPLDRRAKARDRD